MTGCPGARRGGRAAVVAALALLLAGLAACRGGGADTSDESGTEPAPAVSAGTAPGTLLDAEPYDGALASGVQGWRIRYATTDSQGRRRQATGLVVAPTEPARRGPLLAWAHPTTGIAESCAPSTGPLADATASRLADAARRGWVAVATDYAGLGTPGPHEYLVGKAAAHDVLDSVRAARRLVEETDEETVLWGHSQGGHAVLWAALEASSYAPGTTLSGVAATGAPTDLAALLPRGDDTLTGRLVGALVVSAWDRTYPEAGLLDLVPEESRDEVDTIAESCLDQGAGHATAAGAAEELEGDLLPDAAYEGRYGALLRENSPRGRIAAPVLVGQGTEDQVVPAGVTRAWVKARCAEGVGIDYREFPVGHTLSPDSPMLAAVAGWADARVAGKPARRTCG